MVCSVRLNYPNTFHHILSRGNERQDIFRDQHDYENFTDRIKLMVERFGSEENLESDTPVFLEQ